MKRFLLLGLTMLGSANAQFTLPPVNITNSPSSGITLQSSAPLVFEMATRITVQPARVGLRLAPGHTTGVLAFTLLSEVNTEVVVTSNDARLVLKSAGQPLRLSAYNAQTLNLMALAPHTGTITITNSAGQVIARVPYEVAPAKTVNQSASFNYSPSSNRVGLSYSVSGVNSSPLDPSWSAGINLGINTRTGDVSGGVGVSVNW